MWVSNLEELGLQTADPIYKLVSATGSLSDILQSKCKHLSVQVISQQIENHNFIREVYLLGDGIPWVHAITTAPERTYIKFKTQLDNLGNNLLGKTFLYSQSHTRSAFEYAVLEGNLARRSVFNLQDHDLTVQEKFLESIITV
jgi:chorismate-pyruvate lyase